MADCIEQKQQQMLSTYTFKLICLMMNHNLYCNHHITNLPMWIQIVMLKLADDIKLILYCFSLQLWTCVMRVLYFIWCTSDQLYICLVFTLLPDVVWLPRLCSSQLLYYFWLTTHINPLMSHDIWYTGKMVSHTSHTCVAYLLCISAGVSWPSQHQWICYIYVAIYVNMCLLHCPSWENCFLHVHLRGFSHKCTNKCCMKLPALVNFFHMCYICVASLLCVLICVC